MKQTDERYQQYIKVLKEELVAAMGCTEPVAVAYAAAKAREVLGWVPQHSDAHTILASAWKWHRDHPNGFDDK